MTLKNEKTRPKFFQDFQSSNQHGTAVKSHFFKKMCVLWERFPVRRDIYIYIYIRVCVCARMFVIVYDCLCILLGTCKQEKRWWDTLGQTWGQTDQLKMQPLSRLHAQVTPATRTEIINLNFWGMGLQTLCCIPGAGPVTLRSFHSLRCSSP